MRRRLEHGSRLETVLARCDRDRAHAQALETEWQRVFFGPEESSANDRSAVEAARLGSRHTYNAARRLFFFLLDRQVPRARIETATPAEVAAVYGKARHDLAPFVAPPDPMPEIEVSRAIPGVAGADYWLRFKSPSPRLGDTVYARVHEPQGGATRPRSFSATAFASSSTIGADSSTRRTRSARRAFASSAPRRPGTDGARPPAISAASG